MSDVPLGPAELAEALRALRRAALELEALSRRDLDAVAEHDRQSARNLVHYLALRQHDLRPVQRELAARGLSSLGRAEAHVLATLDAVLAHLDPTAPPPSPAHASPTPATCDELLHRHSVAALGPLPEGKQVRVMVTLPSEAAHDAGIVDELVVAGMTLARINGAHDGPEEWRAMAGAVRAAGRAHGRDVRVSFDLAGPKLRTGPLPEGPRVVRVRPRRDAEGHVQRPARVRLVGAGGAGDGGQPTPQAEAHTVVVPTDDVLVAASEVGDELDLRDARGRRRRLRIEAVWPDAIEATSDRTSYLTTGLELVLRRGAAQVASGRVGALPPADSFIDVERGERVRFRRGSHVGSPAVFGADGVTAPASISCDIDEVFSSIAVGHRVLVDDGTIEAVVSSVAADEFVADIVRPASAKLRAEKGINLPDTRVRIPALTADDREALRVMAPIVDLVALSYAGSVDDVAALHHELDELGCPDMAIALKIEHASAFRALPRMLLHALRRPAVAIMLARGDLAVEIGFERLAEVQEEILWLCEAAHVPVIWATQVLESLTKDGLPTRAEVTDAAWASRAECVMLNKGPHIVSAIRFLDDVFSRMNEHQDKRTPMLRRLSVSTALGDLGDLDDGHEHIRS